MLLIKLILPADGMLTADAMLDYVIYFAIRSLGNTPIPFCRYQAENKTPKVPRTPHYCR